MHGYPSEVYSGTVPVRSGSSTTQVFDIVIDPGTAPMTVQLSYVLDYLWSLFDVSAPTTGVRLVYTCT